MTYNAITSWQIHDQLFWIKLNIALAPLIFHCMSPQAHFLVCLVTINAFISQSKFNDKASLHFLLLKSIRDQLWIHSKDTMGRERREVKRPLSQVILCNSICSQHTVQLLVSQKSNIHFWTWLTVLLNPISFLLLGFYLFILLDWGNREHDLLFDLIGINLF